jgi:hypothetical protein
MSGAVSCEAADIDLEQVRPVGTSAGVDAEQVWPAGRSAVVRDDLTMVETWRRELRTTGHGREVAEGAAYSEGAAASDSLADELKCGEPNGRKKPS